MLGKQMLKRLHAYSEWKNLYICGDSTVMATGAPATVVSGVGATNMLLKDAGKKDYDARKFPRSYVEFVEIPYTRPKFGPGDPINAQTAHLAAAQCQGCENSTCVRDCPVSIDIPNILRRMEAQNYAGAARQLRQRSPFGVLCGTLCPAEYLCEKCCFRLSFTGEPVRIAELIRWVDQSAGEEGWLLPGGAVNKQRVAILGGSLAGLTCAYYLALTGLQVSVLDIAVDALVAMPEAQPDLPALRKIGIYYHGRQDPAHPKFSDWLRAYDSLIITADEWTTALKAPTQPSGWRLAQK